MAREHDKLASLKYRNEERDRKVTKRRIENEPTRYYHVTTKKFNHGDILKAPDGEKIFLSDKPEPHQTMAGERVRPPKWFRQGRIDSGGWKDEWDGKWYVYEVEPIGTLEYGIENNEIQVRGAKILRFVGDGRAILAHQEEKSRRRGKNESNMAYGSKVHGVENVKEGRNQVVGHGRMYWETMRLKHSLKGDKN